MSYKIVIDSCGELTDTLKEDAHYENVALELDVDDYHVLDDESFNQLEFLQKVKQSPYWLFSKSLNPFPWNYGRKFWLSRILASCSSG